MKNKNRYKRSKFLDPSSLQFYKSRFEKLEETDLDKGMFPLVKSFDLSNNIIPVFSCSGHGKTSLYIKFVVTKEGINEIENLYEFINDKLDLDVYTVSLDSTYLYSLLKLDTWQRTYTISIKTWNSKNTPMLLDLIEDLKNIVEALYKRPKIVDFFI